MFWNIITMLLLLLFIRSVKEEKHSWLSTRCLYVVFACDACELYQVSERRHVHADGDHAAGETQLVELNVPISKKHGEVEPAAGQHNPSNEGLGGH